MNGNSNNDKNNNSGHSLLDILEGCASDKDNDEEEGDTQEENTQNELTQLADDATTEDESSSSPLISLTPLQIPWGRLVPFTNTNSSGGGIDLLPRSPKEISSSNNNNTNNTVQFLGLDNLHPCDIFNEYTIGRSIKCDVTAGKMLRDEMDDNVVLKTSDCEFVHVLISNKHCRLFSLLVNNNSTTTSNSTSNNAANNSSSNGSSNRSMEVYIEDTSGNGTYINQNILLRRNERRILHTGDEICLIHPPTLYKRISDVNVRRNIIRHYSYIFINVFTQQHYPTTSIPNTPIPNTPIPNTPIPNTPKSKSGGGLVDVSRIAKSPSSSGIGNNLKQQGRHSPLAAPQSLSRTTTNYSNRLLHEYYDVRDLLGTGSCGEVRRGIDRKTGKQRAIKIIANQQTNKNFLHPTSLLQSEVSILQSLSHPYIVQFIDVFVSSNNIYLVMEYVSGGDLLTNILQKGKYNEVDSRRIFRRILSAVYYLHVECDIVHRDLKPENILVCGSDDSGSTCCTTVKLTDFGLAKIMTEDGLKTFCGTPQYFAPEVLSRRFTILGQGTYGKEADMWSLGIILYILLSGKPPFDVNSDNGMGATILLESSTKKISYCTKTIFTDNISQHALDFIQKLLVIDPKKRLNVVQACNDAWILTDDHGDTHCHPLQDPILKLSSSKKQPSSVSLKEGVVVSDNDKKKEEEEKCDQNDNDPNINNNNNASKKEKDKPILSPNSQQQQSIKRNLDVVNTTTTTQINNSHDDKISNSEKSNESNGAISTATTDQTTESTTTTTMKEEQQQNTKLSKRQKVFCNLEANDFALELVDDKIMSFSDDDNNENEKKNDKKE